MEYNAYFQEELQLNHEPSLNHWAHLIAEGEMQNGEHKSYDCEYEEAWYFLDAEYNYNYEYREG
jgi:hypothetical protein